MDFENEIIRVFTRRTSYTPIGDYVFIGRPPLTRPEAKEVHVSCTFTWDKTIAEDLAHDWSKYYPVVKIGGPAYDAKGDEFIPGMYLKEGEVITSRGCPNKCPYCFIPNREGSLRLLEIKNGWDILDNNLLACPHEHIEKVFTMLVQQKHKAMFRGGLEARRIDQWFIDLLSSIRLQCLFLALDRPGDERPVRDAVNKLQLAGYSNRQICCYVLVGYTNDTPIKANERLQWMKSIGTMPFAMYFRDKNNKGETPSKEWQKIIRPFCRPTAIFSKVKEARAGQGALFQ